MIVKLPVGVTIMITSLAIIRQKLDNLPQIYICTKIIHMRISIWHAENENVHVLKLTTLIMTPLELVMTSQINEQLLGKL